MSRSGTASRSSLFRLVLRVSLLGGAVFDLGNALLLMAPILCVPGPLSVLARVAPEAVYHSWLVAPALVARGALQGLACYDLRRYEAAIGMIALTLLGASILALVTGREGAGLIFGVLGGLQLLGWKATRI